MNALPMPSSSATSERAAAFRLAGGEVADQLGALVGGGDERLRESDGVVAFAVALAASGADVFLVAADIS